MTRTGKTYGGALYDLAQEEGLERALLTDFDVIESVWTRLPDYPRLLCTPSIPKAERRALLDEAWRGLVHPYTLNFMKLLCDNGTLRELPACAKEYRRRYNEANGILEVCAVTAAAMSESAQEKLQKKLESVTGKQIALRTRVDESLLGGIRLELPDRQLDGTVAHHLAQIQRMLNNTTI